MPYRAPELFNVSSQCQIDERTDIWSLGCLLFAICFLRGPFDAAYEKGDSLALAANAGIIPFPGNLIIDRVFLVSFSLLSIVGHLGKSLCMMRRV